MDVRIRLVTEDDAACLAHLVQTNRAYLAPWEPVRDEEFFAEPGQRRRIVEALAAHARGTTVPCVTLVDGEVAGRVTIDGILRGAFQSGNLGYWVAGEHAGRGVATDAVGAVVRLAFGELGLHRLQAATLVHNHASRRVLARNGFHPIGVAPRYLQIAGRWQDHLLHQRLADEE